MDALEMRQRGRGRPVGSRKPATELRQRRDYRFSPATVHQIEQGRQLAQTTETAFVETAIQQYVSFLIAKEANSCEVEQLRTRVQDLERELAALQTARIPRALHQHLPPPPSSGRPVPSLPSRKPVFYQISLKHEPGPCPRLPEGFTYITIPESIDPQQCPVHRVFSRPCAIAVARQRVERLKHEGVGITTIWLDKDGYALPRDSWRKEHGRWVRDD